MLNDTLAEVLPALKWLVINGEGRLSAEDICSAEVWAEFLREYGPAHKLMNSELLQEARLDWDLVDSGVGSNAVEEVVLLVVVRG